MVSIVSVITEGKNTEQIIQVVIKERETKYDQHIRIRLYTDLWINELKECFISLTYCDILNQSATLLQHFQWKYKFPVLSASLPDYIKERMDLVALHSCISRLTSPGKKPRLSIEFDFFNATKVRSAGFSIGVNFKVPTWTSS